MPIPLELHMPSLNHLAPNIGTQMLNFMFAKGGPSDDNLRRQYSTFVRLTDLCVSEYKLAQSALLESLPDKENNFGNYLFSIDHLELCLITLRRVYNAFQRITSASSGMRIDRNTRRILENAENDVKNARDAIIHIEEHVHDMRVIKGQSHALLVDENGKTASIGECSISLERLGRTIERFHELATIIAEYREPRSPIVFPSATDKDFV